MQWVEEALEDFRNEDNDETLIINAIKSNEYKKHAFERPDFDYSELDDKWIMSKSCMSGFFPSKPQVDQPDKPVKDDSSMDAVFRSSLKGFFTGKRNSEKAMSEASTHYTENGL